MTPAGWFFLLTAFALAREHEAPDDKDNEEHYDDRKNGERYRGVTLKELHNAEEHEEHKEHRDTPPHCLDGLRAIGGPGTESHQVDHETGEEHAERSSKEETYKEVVDAQHLHERERARRLGEHGHEKREKQGEPTVAFKCFGHINCNDQSCRR